MNIAALLKLFIYLISSSLLYPVMLLLVLLSVWTLITSGAFFAEWLERVRLDNYSPEELPSLIKEPDERSVFPHRVIDYMENLRSVITDTTEKHLLELKVENTFQERTLEMWKSLDKVGMVIRIGPGLGLIGTLIPMGTGLASLGQGDLTKLSSDLVIAFTTTVVGMSAGIIAYFLYTVRKRWLEEDIKNIELATDILFFQMRNEK